MKFRATFLFVCVAALSAAENTKKPVTIDAVAAERPERAGSITWSPDGRRFLYPQGGKYWFYDVGGKSRKELFTTDLLASKAAKPPEEGRFSWQNRRVTESSVQWLNANQILAAAGGDLFLVTLPSGHADQLTNTPEAEADPKCSPDGRSVAFRRGHELFVLDLSTKGVKQITSGSTATLWNGQLDWVYPEELDLGTAYWWSPDGKQIAYLQFDVSKEFVYPQVDLLGLRAVAEPQRYPQAGTPNATVRLGVVPAAGGETRWMNLGDTKDKLLARVHWTPGSKGVAVQVMNRTQSRLDLRLADTTTGESRLLLHEEDPTWVNPRTELYFLKQTPQFLWLSERTGHRQLYLYGVDGKLVKALTQGTFEITDLDGVDEKEGEVYFTSSETSPLERHFYRLALNGFRRNQLTKYAGTHTVSLAPDFQHFLDTFSSLTQPARRVLYKANGNEYTVFQEADKKLLEDYDIPATQMVQYRNVKGEVFHARLIEPPNREPGKKYPAIVVVYGGPGAQSIRNSWPGLTWEHVLAQKGFVVWQVDNHGSAGRGHEWESPLHNRFGATELEDQLLGVTYLISKGFVDQKKIGIYGWSYGGFMTLYSLLHAPERFQVGVAGAPVTNWLNYDTIYTERYLGLPSENPQGYRDSSPVNAAAKLQGKLLLVHNIEDDNVLFQNTMQMANALEKAGKPFQMVVYPLKSHGVSGPLRKQLLETITQYFEQNLK